jgi:hypothetical protein
MSIPIVSPSTSRWAATGLSRSDRKRVSHRGWNTEYVSTYDVPMNLTIAIDDDLLNRARALARRRGTSLQELIREQLRTLAGEQDGATVADELLDLMATEAGRSGGRAWGRTDAYAGRV